MEDKICDDSSLPLFQCTQGDVCGEDSESLHQPHVPNCGYIVGYYEEWASDLNAIIVGYYTTWENALIEVKRLERINIDHHGRHRKVYIVEVEPNKTYPDIPGRLWADSFDHYIVRTECHKTILKHNNGQNSVEIELSPPLPLQSSAASPQTKLPSDPMGSPEPEWQNVRKRRVPKKPKRLSRPYRKMREKK